MEQSDNKELAVQQAQGRIVSLQGLRGVAILLIIVSHYPFIVNSAGANALDWAGAFGVSFFIMLSGFLETRKYYERIKYPELSVVMKRKLKRFYPLHLITLLLAVPLTYRALLNSPLKWGVKFVLNALLLQAWVPVSGVYFSFNAVSWYLSLTMFFIAATPFALRLLQRAEGRLWAFFVLSLVLQAVLAMVGDMLPDGMGHWLAYVFPPVRLLDFLVGGGATFSA